MDPEAHRAGERMTTIALIGAGRIGQIRARSMAETGLGTLVAVVDPWTENAKRIAESTGARVLNNWSAAISDPQVEGVIVATPTSLHAEIATAALSAGKHVLCEKPLARNVSEARQIVAASRRSGTTLKIGFNYRHLPHVRKAKELIDSGVLGRLFFVRCQFGHGGRPGFDQEWHTDPVISGGGVLQEQGIHVMDLVRYLLGEPTRALGQRSTFYWQLREIEDNCFCLFETEGRGIAQIHVSWTQWRNTFQMEIFGQDGYLRLEGRDGHYGPPAITWAKRNRDHSRPLEKRLVFEPGDDWREEWKEFLTAIAEKREPLGSGLDGLRAQQMVEAAYASAEAGKWLTIEPDRGQ